MKIDIDEALRVYVDRPVPLGMEGRILRRVRRRAWVWTAFGFAAAACCAMGLWMVRAPVARPPVRSPVIPASARYRSLTVAAQNEPARKRRLQFEANSLWRFAQEHPEAALQLAEDKEPPPIAPLQFEAIHFDPIQFEPISIEELGDKQ